MDDVGTIQLHMIVVATEVPSKNLELYGVSWRVDARSLYTGGWEGEFWILKDHANESICSGCATRRNAQCQCAPA